MVFLRFAERLVLRAPPRFLATFFPADFFVLRLADLRDLAFVDLPTFFLAELLAFAMVFSFRLLTMKI